MLERISAQQRRLLQVVNRVRVREFERVYANDWKATWHNTRWLGTQVERLPFDLWVYQELIWEVRPDVVVQTGPAHGSSAPFLASICDLVDHGRIVTVDADPMSRIEHPRVEAVVGRSTEPAVVERVGAAISGVVLVILGTHHSWDRVAEELRAYAPYVSVGSYLVVESTAPSGHPVSRHHGPGPMEAVSAFLAEGDEFEADRSREKFKLTFNPGGYLRRIRETS